MKLSASSFFITLIVTAMLIGLLNILLTSHRGHKLFKADFIVIFILVTVLRLLFPFEYSFTKTITAFYKIMNPLMNVILRNRVLGSPVWKWLIIIWGVGSVLMLIKLIITYHKGEMVYKEILQTIKNKHTYNNIPVYVSPLVTEPMIMGVHKAILLPDIEFKEKQLDYILKHELIHIRNHDGLLKLCINILSAIYWWFIPIYILKQDFQLFQEVRVDYKLTKDSDNETVLEYANSLVEVKEKITDFEYPDICNCMVNESTSILTFRIDYLIEGTYKKKTSIFLMMTLIIIPFLTNCIILEPHYNSSEKIKNTYTEDEMKEGYLIHHKDGTYTYVFQGEEYYIKENNLDFLKGVKVIEE